LLRRRLKLCTITSTFRYNLPRDRQIFSSPAYRISLQSQRKETILIHSVEVTFQLNSHKHQHHHNSTVLTSYTKYGSWNFIVYNKHDSTSVTSCSFARTALDLSTDYGFQVLTAKTTKSFMLWDIMPHNPVKFNPCIGGTYRLHLESRRLN
jgi:hypothetical protein